MGEKYQVIPCSNPDFDYYETDSWRRALLEVHKALVYWMDHAAEPENEFTVTVRVVNGDQEN